MITSAPLFVDISMGYNLYDKERLHLNGNGPVWFMAMAGDMEFPMLQTIFGNYSAI